MKTGWFAGLGDEEDRNPKWPWRAYLQLDSGCYPLPVHFTTEEDCLNFIRREVIGQDMLGESP